MIAISKLQIRTLSKAAALCGAILLVFSNWGCTPNPKKNPSRSKNANLEKSGQILSLSSEELVLGHVGALTGKEASFGTSIGNGIKMAVEAVNQKGGIHGKSVRLISKDDGGDPVRAARATEELIDENSAIGILGAAASSRSLAMAEVAQKKKVPMISPSSTNPKVTEVGDYVFRVCFIDPFQGPVMAKYVFETLKARKVAIIRDIKSDYSLGLAQYFKQKFVELGGQIVSDQSYNASDVDFRSQLTAVKQAKPDLIYVPGYYSDVANIIVQAREMGIQVPFAGGDGWESSELFNVGGKALDGSFFTSHYSPSAKDPVMREFVKKYRKKYGSIPDALAALGYDAAKIILSALEKTGGESPAKLRDGLAQTKNFKGATGLISIDPKRNAIKPAVIFMIEGGRAKYVQTIAP